MWSPDSSDISTAAERTAAADAKTKQSIHLNNGGLIRISGTLPVVVLEAVRMIGAQRISKGRYRILHEDPMPSDQYSVTPSVMDSRPLVVRVTARTPNYAEIRVTDLAGAAQDPVEVTIETKRVVY